MWLSIAWIGLLVLDTFAFDRSAVERQVRHWTDYGRYYGGAVNPFYVALSPQRLTKMTKAEVQGKPQGISDYSARLAYKKATSSPAATSYSAGMRLRDIDAKCSVYLR